MGRSWWVEAEWATGSSDLAAFLGPARPVDRAPRVLGLFAHPDDEVFCVGGTIARCADAGAVTGVVSLTHGETGQIRDAAVSTRGTLGRVRFKELQASASALGVDHVECLDLGDGRLTARSTLVRDAVRGAIEDFEPDVVVTFGPDGGFGHPDHIASCVATQEVVGAMEAPPRLLHARFPRRGDQMAEIIVDWLAEQPGRFHGNLEFAHALKLFAGGTNSLGVTADHLRTEWYPPGSFIIEQGEAATEVVCILSGDADVAYESCDGQLKKVHSAGPGSFVGEEGLGPDRLRTANVIARDTVTCLVLSRERPSTSAGRGHMVDAQSATSGPGPGEALEAVADDCLVVDVMQALDRKVAALCAHRSQYALEADLLPTELFARLLGRERFVVASA